MEHRDYTLSEICLGYGCRGSTVRRGTHEGRKAAVKLFPEQDNQVKVQSLQSMKKINSDYVVRYFKAEIENGMLLVFMEQCDGSLVDYITFKKNPNSLDSMPLKRFKHCDFLVESKKLIKDMIKGLYVLHDLNCVHGDIKPNNILIAHRERWRAKIDMSITSFGSGTQGWRPAEFILGPLKAAGDIFSLGLVIFYYISGGQHPYEGNDDSDRERNILRDSNKNIFLPQETPEEARKLMTSEARNLIEVMLRKDPKKRPTAKDLLKHPFFWSSKKALDFLQNLSDMIFSGLVKSAVVSQMNLISTLTQLFNLDGRLNDEILALSGYETPKAPHLLRQICNTAHRFHNYPSGLFRNCEQGVYEYYSKKLPNLVIELYGVVSADRGTRELPEMKRFFD